MGKIHDALKKSGHAEDLKMVPAVKPKTVNRQAAKKDIQIVNPEAEKSVQRRQESWIDPLLIAYQHPTGVEAETFKILRTNILFPKIGSAPRTILVTSAIPGDGKSFVAANLATSIAHGIEDHVLLIDCDMRRSRIHRIFGYQDGISGLSDYLTNKKPLDALLKKTAVKKLSILPGGPTPPNPSELLSSQSMKQLLKETKERYSDRYIIVDSPPPQLTAETTALAKYIDGIILVIKYGTTPKDMIKDLLENLGRDKMIGVVMNGYRVPATERYGFGKYKTYKKY